MWLKPGIIAASAGASPASFTMTQLASANQIFQRDSLTGGGQGKGQGTVPVSVAVTAAGAIYARRRSTDGSNTILQAPWLVGGNVSTATTTLNVSGVDAPAFTSSALPSATNDGWFYLDLSGDGATWQNGTTAITMGDLTSFAGQNIATCFFNRDAVDTTNTITSVLGDAYVSDYGRVFLAYDGSTNHFPTNPVTTSAPASMSWAKPVTGGTYDSTAVVEFLKRMIASDGVAHGAIGYTHSGVGIHTWNPTQTSNSTTLLKSVQASAAPRGWRREMWYHGHSDSSYGVSVAAYKLGLENIGLAKNGTTAVSGGFSANNPYVGTVQRYMGAYPIVNNSSSGTAKQLDRVRSAGKSFAADNGWTYVDASDVAVVNGVTTGSGATSGVNLARDFYRAMTPNGNVGPSLVSASRGTTAGGSPKVITVVMSDLGTDLQTSGSTWYQRFKVFNAGSSSQWTISSGTKVDATHVTLTLASDPGDGQALDIRANWLAEGVSDTSSVMLRDNRLDGDGITVGRPIAPYFNAGTLSSAITCAAPGSGTTNTPNTVVAPSSTYDITMVSPTYSSAGVELVTGFGNYLNGGKGKAGNTPGPYNIGLTAELFFSVSALPSSDSIIFSTGPGSGARGDLMLSSAGKLKMLTIATSGLDSGLSSPIIDPNADVIVPGKVYHAALMLGPHGSTVFCKNITDNVNFTPFTSNTPWFGTPKSNNYCIFELASGLSSLTNASACHLAVWEGERWYSGGIIATSHTPPTTPLVGNEANLIALYRFNGDATDSVKAAA